MSNLNDTSDSKKMKGKEEEKEGERLLTQQFHVKSKVTEWDKIISDLPLKRNINNKKDEEEEEEESRRLVELIHKLNDELCFFAGEFDSQVQMLEKQNETIENLRAKLFQSQQQINNNNNNNNKSNNDASFGGSSMSATMINSLSSAPSTTNDHSLEETKILLSEKAMQVYEYRKLIGEQVKMLEDQNNVINELRSQNDLLFQESQNAKKVFTDDIRRVEKERDEKDIQLNSIVAEYKDIIKGNEEIARRFQSQLAKLQEEGEETKKKLKTKEYQNQEIQELLLRMKSEYEKRLDTIQCELKKDNILATTQITQLTEDLRMARLLEDQLQKQTMCLEQRNEELERNLLSIRNDAQNEKLQRNKDRQSSQVNFDAELSQIKKDLENQNRSILQRAIEAEKKLSISQNEKEKESMNSALMQSELDGLREVEKRYSQVRKVWEQERQLLVKEKEDATKKYKMMKAHLKQQRINNNNNNNNDNSNNNNNNNNQNNNNVNSMSVVIFNESRKLWETQRDILIHENEELRKTNELLKINQNRNLHQIINNNNQTTEEIEDTMKILKMACNRSESARASLVFQKSFLLLLFEKSRMAEQKSLQFIKKNLISFASVSAAEVMRNFSNFESSTMPLSGQRNRKIRLSFHVIATTVLSLIHARKESKQFRSFLQEIHQNHHQQPIEYDNDVDNNNNNINQANVVAVNNQEFENFINEIPNESLALPTSKVSINNNGIVNNHEDDDNLKLLKERNENDGVKLNYNSEKEFGMSDYQDFDSTLGGLTTTNWKSLSSSYLAWLSESPMREKESSSSQQQADQIQNLIALPTPQLQTPLDRNNDNNNNKNNKKNGNDDSFFLTPRKIPTINNTIINNNSESRILSNSEIKNYISKLDKAITTLNSSRAYYSSK